MRMIQQSFESGDSSFKSNDLAAFWRLRLMLKLAAEPLFTAVHEILLNTLRHRHYHNLVINPISVFQ